MKVGFTCGTFDLLHAGHINMLEQAKRNCDYLIVGLQTDPTVDRKEKNKPVQDLIERQLQLRGVKYVDEIVVYTTESELLQILDVYNIDIRFVGEEYKGKKFTGSNFDHIEIFYNRRQHSYSSTDLRARTWKAEQEKKEAETYDSESHASFYISHSV